MASKPTAKAAQYPDAVSPITGRVVNISASAYSTWTDCPRKWFYQYVARIPTPMGPALTTGIAVHDILEAYLRDGTKPPPERNGAIASAGLHLLPEPGTVSVEEWVKSPCGPMPFVGKVDWYTEGGVVLRDGPRGIGDHKTTSDFKWAQTSESLALNPQMLAYARCLWHENPPDSVDLSHVYYRTRGTPMGLRVDAPAVPWHEVETAWAGYVAAAVEMAATIGSDPLQAVANPTKCGKYGGCPFADQCADSPTNRAEKARRAILARNTPRKGRKNMGSKSKDADRAKRRAAILAGGAPKEGGANPPDAAPHDTAAESRGGLIEEAAKTLVNVLGIMGGSLPVVNAEAAIQRVGVPVGDLPAVLEAAGMFADGDTIRQGSAPDATNTKPVLASNVPPPPLVVDDSGDAWAVGIAEDHARAIRALLAAFPVGSVATFSKVKAAIAADKIWGRIHRSRVEAVLEDGAKVGFWEYDADNLSLMRSKGSAPAAAAVVPAMAAVEAHEKETKKERKARKKAEKARKKAEAALAAATPAETVRPPDTNPGSGYAETLRAERFVYVGCLPERSGVNLQPWAVWTLLADIEEACKDGQPSPYLRPYNDGQKAVASALAAAFYRGDCLDWTHLFIPSDYPGASMLLGLLRDLPDTLVIRGGF